MRKFHPIVTIVLLFMIGLFMVLLACYFGLATRVFRSFGLSPQMAFLVLLVSLVGSLINLPLSRRRIVLVTPAWEHAPSWLRSVLPLVYYEPPIVTEQLLAVNLGGAVVPVVFSAYLLIVHATPLLPAGIAIIWVALVAKLAARLVPGAGVTLPGFIPPIVAALSAHFLTLWLTGNVARAAPVAYIAGTLGTLLGADVFNLPAILNGALETGTELGATRMVSIGGAGVFDGIFLTSIIAPFLA